MRVLPAIAALVITLAVFIAVPTAILKYQDGWWHPTHAAAVRVAEGTGIGTAFWIMLFVPIVARSRRRALDEAAQEGRDAGRRGRDGAADQGDEPFAPR